VSDPRLRLEYDGPIAIITNDNQEKRNAFDDDMDVALFDAFDELRHRTDVRAVIWRGEGIYVEAMVRMGFIVPLASRVAFWGRAGVGTINGPELAWGNAQADVVLLAGDSFGVTLGATLDVPFDDRRKIYRALGLMLGMVWY